MSNMRDVSTKVKPLCKCGNPAVVLQISRCPRLLRDAHSLDEPGRIIRAAERLAMSPEEKEEQWRFSCFECDRDAEYWVDLARIGDATKALGWTAHLAEKIWFDRTSASWFSHMRDLFPEMDAA